MLYVLADTAILSAYAERCVWMVVTSFSACVVVTVSLRYLPLWWHSTVAAVVPPTE